MVVKVLTLLLEGGGPFSRGEKMSQISMKHTIISL